MKALIAIALLLAARLAVCADPADGWRNLKRITRDRLYAVILRDGQCKWGSLSSVGDGVFVLGLDSGLGLAIKRSEVLRVSDTSNDPARDIVFSGRSSWSDVKEAGPKRSEYLEIVTKEGEDLKWRRPEVSDESIRFEGRTVAKNDVRSVTYVRLKPLTIDEEYGHHEDFAWLASRPWVGSLIMKKMNVLLYNAEIEEDNSPIACR